jgi:glycosyltransferase 2 family protein
MTAKELSLTLSSVTSKAWWPWARRLLSLAFFLLVAYLLTTYARTVEWDEVLSTMRQRPTGSILLACLPAFLSYALYSCFDLLGRHATGHRMKTAQVMAVNFICYAFNLNLGALIGGVAFRYRLYSRFGLDAETVTRILMMSMLTNWIGYLLLSGPAFLLSPVLLPDDWKIGTAGIRVLGCVMTGIAIAYLALCAFSARRAWSVRGHEISLPSFRIALLQLAISTANWLLIATTIYLLLDQALAFPLVLSVLLIAAIAGVITHVPAGLGVLEAVFVALLADRLPTHVILAAFLTYRVVYYIGPLCLATVAYLLIEAKMRGAVNDGGC